MDKFVDRVADFYDWAFDEAPVWATLIIITLSVIVGLLLLFVSFILVVLNPTVSTIVFAYVSWLLFKKVKRMYQESRK